MAATARVGCPCPFSPEEVDAARAAADEWVPPKRLTLEAELPAVEDYAVQRQRLWAIGDVELVRTLRRSDDGAQLVLRVVDAAMRALPHGKALDGAGSLLNTLFARQPRRRLPPLWALPGRVVTRRMWLRRVARYGDPR